ncbi:hypothetical protein TNCT_349611 [Trichonephila clavata]|uniref:Uncharacterized protein n=1 Tax=Trichonephila clavata TaxID=2740835 RepID=A0A8X6LZG0_TRICU|nr:hypothetical protein TNCT_349611 [Trichonephila clavata]
MNVKRPAENDNRDQQFHSQHKHKKCKKENGCARCFTELPENFVQTHAGAYCPNCFEELKREYQDVSAKPSYCVELKETFAENPIFIPFPPRDEKDYNLIYMTCVLMNLNVADFVDDDESDDEEIDDQNTEGANLIEKEERKGNALKAPQG